MSREAASSDGPRPARTAAVTRCFRLIGAVLGIVFGGGLAGTVTPASATTTAVPATSNVPDFFIDHLEVPPFLLPIFQAAGVTYNLPWQALAAVNQIETNFGRNLSRSSAGALGWMQLLPSTWKEYGVDANGDGLKDPYNAADAIFTAARFLRAAGGSSNLDNALSAYNQTRGFAESVVLRADLIGGLPSDLLNSITGLGQGVFPVDGPATYADAATQASTPVIAIYAKAASPVLAANDGVITAVGATRALGGYVELRDVFGNTYAYSQLAGNTRPGRVAVSQDNAAGPLTRATELPIDAAPRFPASAGHQATDTGPAASRPAVKIGPVATDTDAGPERLFAHPMLPAPFAAGGRMQLARARRSEALRTRRVPNLVAAQPLRVGTSVLAGAVLGRVAGGRSGGAPHVNFQIFPGGDGASGIDPKPVLDAWRLFDTTARFRSIGADRLLGPAENPAVGQIMLEGIAQLEQGVLADQAITLSPSVRTQIDEGLADPLVLRALEFLSASGLQPTVSALSAINAAGIAPGAASPLSADAPATEADISAINGVPISGHQGTGSITDLTIRRLLSLPGSFEPLQIVSLMTYPATTTTLGSFDHADRISLVFAPSDSPTRDFSQSGDPPLTAEQWARLSHRLGQIANPTVASRPSSAAIPTATAPQSRSTALPPRRR